MNEESNAVGSVSDLLEDLYLELEQAEENIGEAKSYANDSQQSSTEALDYCDYAENRLYTMKETVNQLRDMSGEFNTKKAKAELTKLIDSLTKQQAKLG